MAAVSASALGGKPEAGPNSEGMRGEIQGTDGSNPREYGRCQAPEAFTTGFSRGFAHAMASLYGQVALRGDTSKVEMIQGQLHCPSMVNHFIGSNSSFDLVPQLNARQLTALMAP